MVETLIKPLAEALGVTFPRPRNSGRTSRARPATPQTRRPAKLAAEAARAVLAGNDEQRQREDRRRT